MPRCLPCLLLAAAVLGQQPDTALRPDDPPIDPTGIRGARFVAGGGGLPPAASGRFVELAGGDDAKIVLVPTASARAADPEARERLLADWRTQFPATTFSVLHTDDRSTADSEEFAAVLQTATGVWFGGGVQARLASAYLGTRFERELMALCARGGVVGGTSAGAAIQSRTMIQEGVDPPVIATGFDLVPGAIVDQHFTERERLPRLLLALQASPGRFGLGVDEGTAVEIEGRRLRVRGSGNATLVLAAGGGRPQRVEVLQNGKVADLVAWRRAARDRAGDPWPPPAMRPPVVQNGALVLVGGGQLGPAIVDRFVALAGGEHARIALVPSASPRDVRRGRDPFLRLLQDRGVAEVWTFDPAVPADVTVEQVGKLGTATGVWFGGGRQWRLCDAFEGTAAVAAFASVLERGGVLGGTSAGATIQADFLVRGNPLGNREEWCEGYDRGFGFLPGCAVDQHFMVRDRTADLQGLVARFPQLIGLGIDEGTAAVVQGGAFEVVGDSTVAVFDARRREDGTRREPAPHWLEPGMRWDLVAGRRLP